MLDTFEGRDVLITGAGGYIGSALAVALRRASVGNLALLDSSEQNLFDLRRNLEGDARPTRARFVLGSVADLPLVAELLAGLNRPFVIHAAAYKHVSLLETQFLAAVRNNTVATYRLVQTARERGAARLLLISTDKAVNPRSVMGASKRAAELLTLPLNSNDFCVNAVRLGNVWGSTGSVVPLLREQHARGQRLTISDPRAARYFFSVEAAVELILRATAVEVHGRVLLPESSSPVKIVDLAQSMFPGAAMEYVGLRPGEKLVEEFVGPDEKVAGLSGGGLRVVETKNVPADQCEQVVQALETRVGRRDRAGLLRSLCDLVPEYVPSEAVLRDAGGF